MKFEFSEQEVRVLASLIDIAVKSGGMQVAEAGVILSKKLANPIKEDKNKEAPVEPDK